MSLMDKIEIPRRTAVLFFVVDTSGSMAGSKISAVNTAIKEAIPAIKEISDENADAQIKIAVLEFSSGVRWVTSNGPEELDQFHWSDLEADGVTDFGAACKALNEKLSTKAFTKEAIGSFVPIIFLIMGSEPTDDWQIELAKLKLNNWFRASAKFAVAIGKDANKDVLKAFTSSMKAVLTTINVAILKKMIRRCWSYYDVEIEMYNEMRARAERTKTELDALLKGAYPLFDVMKQIVTEKGEEILLEPKRVKAFFSDLAKDEPKPQKRAIIECLEHNVVGMLKGVTEEERTNCKEKLAQKLNAEEGLELRLYREAINTLCAVLYHLKEEWKILDLNYEWDSERECVIHYDD